MPVYVCISTRTRRPGRVAGPLKRPTALYYVRIWLTSFFIVCMFVFVLMLVFVIVFMTVFVFGLHTHPYRE